MIRVCLDKTIICGNKASAFIDRWGHGDCRNSFRSRNICNKMSIHFGWNMNDGISVNPSRTIGIVSPQITVLKSGTGIGFGYNSSGGILPRNIGVLILFNIGALDFSNRITSSHGTTKSESENPGGNSIFKNTGRENNFEVERVGRKNYEIFNHTNSNHINTNSNCVN